MKRKRSPRIRSLSLRGYPLTPAGLDLKPDSSRHRRHEPESTFTGYSLRWVAFWRSWRWRTWHGGLFRNGGRRPGRGEERKAWMFSPRPIALCRRLLLKAPNRADLLHRMDRILRIVLARKEKMGWLDEPNLDRVAPGIKAEVHLAFFQMPRHRWESILGAETDSRRLSGSSRRSLHSTAERKKYEAWRR